MENHPNTAEPIKSKKTITTMSLNVGRIRKRRRDLNRLIDTVRFLGHIISGGFVRPGSATSAELSKFTPSAFSLIAIRVSKMLKDFGLSPDFLKRFFSHISTVQLEIAAGLDLANMRDETEGDASQTSSGHSIQSICFVSDL